MGSSNIKDKKPTTYFTSAKPPAAQPKWSPASHLPPLLLLARAATENRKDSVPPPGSGVLDARARRCPRGRAAPRPWSPCFAAKSPARAMWVGVGDLHARPVYLPTYNGGLLRLFRRVGWFLCSSSPPASPLLILHRQARGFVFQVGAGPLRNPTLASSSLLAEFRSVFLPYSKDRFVLVPRFLTV